MKLKVKKKETTFDILNKKIDSLIEIIIPMIILLIPVLFVLYVLNIHGYIFPKVNGEPIFSLHKYYFYLMIVLSLIYVYKLCVMRIKITKSDIFLFIFMFWTIISTLTSYNKSIAINGYPGRYEGLFAILFYIFLYLDCKFLKNKENIFEYIKYMLFTAVIHFIVVVLQLSGLYGKVIYMYTSNTAIGLTENCNFLGSLMCTFAMISVACYMLFSKKKDDLYFLFIFLVSYATLLLANSTGPFISFIFSLILFIVYLIVKKQLVLKKVFVIVCCLIVLYPICLYKKDTITPDIKSHTAYIVSKVKGLFSKQSESSSDKVIDNMDIEVRNLGNGRIRIWSNVFKLIKKRPLLGYGPDNLGLVYEKSADDNKIADKAHNIYLHIWVSSGIFALIGYILWVIYTIYLGIKNDNPLVVCLIFGVIAYSIQGLFNINVLEVTPYFYLILGFAMLLVNEKKLQL